MSAEDHIKELRDGEWEDVYPATEAKPHEPKEGNILFIQTELGKYLKYVYEDGRYNLVGTVE